MMDARVGCSCRGLWASNGKSGITSNVAVEDPLPYHERAHRTRPTMNTSCHTTTEEPTECHGVLNRGMAWADRMVGDGVLAMHASVGPHTQR
jgi:hypothetical protein